MLTFLEWGEGPFENSVAQDLVNNTVKSQKRSLKFLLEHLKQVEDVADPEQKCVAACCIELANVAKGYSKEASLVAPFVDWLRKKSIKQSLASKDLKTFLCLANEIVDKMDETTKKSLSRSLRNLEKENKPIKDVSFDFKQLKRFCRSSGTRDFENSAGLIGEHPKLFLSWLSPAIAVQLSRIPNVEGIQIDLEEGLDWESMIYPLQILLRRFAHSLDQLSIIGKFGTNVGAFCAPLIEEFRLLQKIEDVRFERFNLIDREFHAICVGRPIRVVDVANAKLTGKALSAISKSKYLKSVLIENCPISTKAISKFEKENPALKVLRIE